jgi:3-carboxy-cis,cis-muconate cycloisomerase
MFDSQFNSTEIQELLSQPRLIERMLRFEAALADTQGELGLIPLGAAHSIGAICRDPKVSCAIDLSEARHAGNPAIPFVKQLTERVRAADATAAAWVHFGATSQDVIDTVTMLSLRDVFGLINRDLDQLRTRLAVLAKTHAQTAMPARTLLQHAIATTFGFKAATWLGGLDRIAQRLGIVATEDLTLQLGGPVGTLSVAVGEEAEGLTTGVASRLGLARPAISWHTSRERIASCGAVLAILTGQLGKIARDVVLAMQTEVGELSEAPSPGKGGSSAMPHKHNPVDSLPAIAAANIAPQLAAGLMAAMVQEHERAAGAWHAEWSLLPRLCNVSHNALQSVLQLMNGLQVHSARMQENISMTEGQMFAAPLANALAPELGRDRAHALAESLCRTAKQEHKSLREVVERDLEKLGGSLSPGQIEAIFTANRDVAAAAAAARYYLEHRSSASV